MERLWPVAKCIGAKLPAPLLFVQYPCFPQLLTTTANSTDVSLLCTLYLWLFLKFILIALIVFLQGTHRYLLAWYTPELRGNKLHSSSVPGLKKTGVKRETDKGLCS